MMVVPTFVVVASSAAPTNVPVGERSITDRGVAQLATTGGSITCVGVTAREHCALRSSEAARLAFSTRVKPEGHVESETGVEPARDTGACGESAT